MGIFAVENKLHIAGRTIAKQHFRHPPGGGPAVAGIEIEFVREFLSGISVEPEPGIPVTRDFPDNVAARLAVIVVGPVLRNTHPRVPVICKLYGVIKIKGAFDIVAIVIPAGRKIDIVPAVADNPPVIGGAVLPPCPTIPDVVSLRITKAINLKVRIFYNRSDRTENMFPGRFFDYGIGCKAEVLLINAAENRLSAKTPGGIVSAQAPIDSARIGRMTCVLTDCGQYGTDTGVHQDILFDS